MRRTVGLALGALLCATLAVALAGGVIYGTRVPSRTDVRVYVTVPASSPGPTDDPLRHPVLAAMATQLVPTPTETPFPAAAISTTRLCPQSSGVCTWGVTPSPVPTPIGLPRCETPIPGDVCQAQVAPTGAAFPPGLR